MTAIFFEIDPRKISDDAYGWYSDPAMTKTDFQNFASGFGVDLFDAAAADGVEWNDLAMMLYDASRHYPFAAEMRLVEGGVMVFPTVTDAGLWDQQI